MPKLTQRLINKTARACAKYQAASNALMEACREKYGVEPGDVDCDEIIDAMLGGCGTASPMTLKDFDAAMRQAIKST